MALNRPSGDALIRKGADSTTVCLYVGAARVRRTKGKGVNSYAIGSTEYVSFGTGVPEEVEDLLGLTEHNLQGQHDSPFWFGLTPGQVSRELNQVFDLESIDRALSFVAAEHRAARSETQLCEKRVAAAEAEVESLAWVKEAEVRFGEVEAVRREYRDRVQRVGTLQDLLGALPELDRVLAAGSPVQAFAACEENHRDLEELRARLRPLESLLARIEQAEESLQCASESLREAHEKLDGVKQEGCPLCGAAIPR